MYTDPGSGLFFAQLIIAGLLGILYRFRRSVSSKLGRKRSPDPNS
jgi:hypothetical protein